MRTATLAILVLLPLAAHAQMAHQTLYSGLTGPDLLTALRTQETAPATLGYGPARDSIYTWEQRTYGRLRCVYTGFQVVIPISPGHDASTEAFSRGINAEHTWPQSQGAGSEPQQSDLHNLYPSREDANAARGNLPFGESPDAQTNRWYRLAGNQTGVPTVALPEWSELRTNTLFEPREDHKGNVARSMLYFRSRWPAASAAYLTSQIETLVAWSEADPVDQAEWNRMLYVQRLQHNRNPFIVDPSLARRAFLPETIEPEPTPSLAVTAPVVWMLGAKQVVRWSGPGVPDGTQYVVLQLRQGDGAFATVGRYKNKGVAKYVVPASLAPGTGYQARVVREDDAAVFGLSGRFTVAGPAQLYTFTAPGVQQTYARGTTRTLRWTAPSAAPAGPLRLTLQTAAGAPVSSWTVTGSGTFDWAIPPTLSQTSYAFSVVNLSDSLYFGTSPLFDVRRIEVVAPGPGTVWTAGTTADVAWSTSLGTSGTVKLTLRQTSASGTATLASGEANDGAATVAVPAVAPAADYVVELRHTSTAGAVTVVRSQPFEIAGGAPLARLAPPSTHFVPAPAPEAEETLLLVAAPGLADGDEVAAFAGAWLVGAGRVAGGVAEVRAASVVVDAEGDAVAPAPALSLRTWRASTGAETDLPVAAVARDGVAVPLSLGAGAVLSVATARSEEDPAAAMATLAVTPNPSAGDAVVQVVVEAPGAVRVAVVDLLGREVAVLAEGVLAAGTHHLRLAPAGLRAGVYAVRRTGAGATESVRLTVVR